MKVKLILPSLAEAGGPDWRPIKYSLFPPLGLATLAAYLDEDDEVTIQDEHVEALDLDDADLGRIWSASRSTLRRRGGPMRWPTTTAAAAHTWRWAACT